VGLVVFIQEALPQSTFIENGISQFGDYFSTPYGDTYSSMLLNQLFGPIFPTPGNERTATLFSRLIGVINLAVIGVAGVILFYNIVVALLQTAHEGIIFGGRFSSLWAPIRILLAIALLLPVPGLGGYNLIQSSVAWLVKGSTVMASELWKFGAEELISGDIPMVVSGSKLDPEVFKTIYRNQLCAKLANYQLEVAGSPTRIEFQENVHENHTIYISYLGERDEGICGSYSLPAVPSYITRLDPVYAMPITHEFNQLHREVLNSLIQQINLIINQQWSAFVDESEQPPEITPDIQRIFTDVNLRLANGNDNIRELVTGNELQEGSARRIIQDYIGGSNCNAPNSLEGGYSQCSGEGWLGAGNWYMTIARLNTELTGLLKASLGASESTYINNEANNLNRSIVQETDEIGFFGRLFGTVDEGKYLHLAETGRIWNVLNTNMERATISLATSGFLIPDSILGITTNGEGGLLGKIWKVGFVGGIESMIANLSPSRWSDDPIIGVVNIGHWYLDAAGALIVGSSVASLLASSVSTTVTFLIAGPLVAVGISLSFILPLLPFFFWIVGIASYFLLVVEAVVASSLWALAHFRMDGEGLSGNFGQRGWLILFGLLSTPPLMVLGYFVGMILFKTTTGLLDTGFYFAMGALVNSSPIVGIFGLIATGFLLVMAYIAIIERSFSLIVEFPKRVLSWIGGDMELPYGSEYQKFEAGGKAFSSSMGRGFSQFGGGISRGMKLIKFRSNNLSGQ